METCKCSEACGDFPNCPGFFLVSGLPTTTPNEEGAHVDCDGTPYEDDYEESPEQRLAFDLEYEWDHGIFRSNASRTIYDNDSLPEGMGHGC